MALHPHLFRSYEATDISWSHVGPHHERCLFILPELIGYHPVAHNDRPPYRLYNVFGWSGPALAENSYATIPAAKRAGRAWIERWLASTGAAEIEWRTESSGVHFVANAAGLRIAQYYHNTDPEKPMNPHGGRWSVGFRAHFGGTYYLPPIDTPEKAKQAVAETWDRWLKLAKLHLLKSEKAAA
jgi:hypothetical protein